MSIPTIASHFPEGCPLSEAVYDLHRYPDVAADKISRHARVIGLAGEAFVDSLLLRHGLVPAPLPEGLSADRLVQTPGGVARLQIKTCTQASPAGYAFRMQKGYRGSPAGRREYASGDYDIAALVVLPRNAVFFTHQHVSTYLVRHDDIPRLLRDPMGSFEVALSGFLDPDATDLPLFAQP